MTELRRALPFLLLPLLLLVAGCGLLPWNVPGVGPVASPAPGGERRTALDAGRIARGYKGGTADVAYGENGIPIVVALDPIVDAVDDELSIRVLELTPAS